MEINQGDSSKVQIHSDAALQDIRDIRVDLDPLFRRVGLGNLPCLMDQAGQFHLEALEDPIFSVFEDILLSIILALET